MEHVGSLLSDDVTMECVTENGRVWQLDAVFAYDADDPYAVTVAFRVHDEVVPWAFARELLDRGMTDTVGEGDVLVRPGVNRLGRAVTVIELSSDDGEFRAAASTRDVMRFLQRSYELVPAETESERLDLDGLVSALLG